MFNKEQKAVIKSRINNYRRYDLKRFGSNEDSITYEEYLELIIEQKGKCYWTGQEMTIDEDKPSDVSLDRLFCDQPHTKENCVLTTRACNLGRNDSSLLDWSLYLYTLGILADNHVQDLTKAGVI